MRDNVRSDTNAILLHQARRRHNLIDPDFDSYEYAITRTAALGLLLVAIMGVVAWSCGWIGGKS